jgi:exodeoxyribonuclease V alpha subunit
MAAPTSKPRHGRPSSTAIALFREALAHAHADPATRRRQVFAAFRSLSRALRAARDGAWRPCHQPLVGRHLQQSIGDTHATVTGSPWYPGRPVMVLRNDYVLKLFNGDIGICLPDDPAS